VEWNCCWSKLAISMQDIQMQNVSKIAEGCPKSKAIWSYNLAQRRNTLQNKPVANIRITGS